MTNHEPLQPLDYEEPTQLRLFPPTKEYFYDYLAFLMRYFDAVTVLRMGDNLTDGVLVDVSSDNPHDKAVGLERLKNSFVCCELPTYLN